MARKGIHLRTFFEILNCLGEIGLEKIAETFTNAERCHVLAKKKLNANNKAPRLARRLKNV